MATMTKTEQKRDYILRMLRQWADEHGGEPPKTSDWRNVRGTHWPSYLTVIRAFGSWDAAIQAAGYEPRGRGRPMKL